MPLPYGLVVGEWVWGVMSFMGGLIALLSGTLYVWYTRISPNLEAFAYIASVIEDFAPAIEEMRGTGGGRTPEGLMGFLNNTPIGQMIQQYVGNAIKKGMETPYGP